MKALLQSHHIQKIDAETIATHPNWPAYTYNMPTKINPRIQIWTQTLTWFLFEGSSYHHLTSFFWQRNISGWQMAAAVLVRVTLEICYFPRFICVFRNCWPHELYKKKHNVHWNGDPKCLVGPAAQWIFSNKQIIPKKIWESSNDSFSRKWNWKNRKETVYFRSTPHPVTVTTRIITFFSRESL